VSPPGATYASGLTTAGLGAPSLDEALVQHAAYCAALERCGVTLTRLEADDRFPDGTFVEDTSVLTERVAIFARSGAPSRQGEVTRIADVLARFYERWAAIVAPGTLDAGDVCEVGPHFFIGLSARTNEAGATQLAAILAAEGYTSSTIDIRESRTLLHLKSGMSWLGADRLVLVPELAAHAAFQKYETIVVDEAETYGANCIVVNGEVLIPTGYPRLEQALARQGRAVTPLAVSEFRKMDGGLSCLSLRF
jgi:dimethylargininase